METCIACTSRRCMMQSHIFASSEQVLPVPSHFFIVAMVGRLDVSMSGENSQGEDSQFAISVELKGSFVEDTHKLQHGIHSHSRFCRWLIPRNFEFRKEAMVDLFECT